MTQAAEAYTVARAAYKAAFAPAATIRVVADAIATLGEAAKAGAFTTPEAVAGFTTGLVRLADRQAALAAAQGLTRCLRCLGSGEYKGRHRVGGGKVETIVGECFACKGEGYTFPKRAAWAVGFAPWDNKAA